jgi:hypothetical protein
VGEFEDYGLLREFARAGHGLIPVPALQVEYFTELYGLKPVGIAAGVSVQFYASVRRAQDQAPGGRGHRAGRAPDLRRAACCLLPSAARRNEGSMIARPGWSSPAAAVREARPMNSSSYAGVLRAPGINVMYGQDYYPEGHQGGSASSCTTSAIASNGDVRLEASPGQWAPIPKPASARSTRRSRKSAYRCTTRTRSAIARVFNPIEYPNLTLDYTVRARPAGRIDHRERRFLTSGAQGVDRQGQLQSRAVPRPVVRQVVPDSARATACSSISERPRRNAVLGTGTRLDVAPETDLYHLTIEALKGGELELLDGRGNHNNGWFVVRALATPGADAGRIEWRVTPHAKAGWMRTPGDPGVAGGLSPGAAQAGDHRARSARHDARRT